MLNHIHDDNDFIIRYSNVFNEEELKEIIKQIEYFDEKSFLGHDGGSTYNQDSYSIHLTHGNSYDLPKSSYISGLILSKFSPCVKHYLKKYSVLGKNKFLVYNCKVKKILSGGGFHSWHYENAALTTAARQFVIQAYFNDDFEGGETEFLYQNKREKAVAGDVIIFPSAYTHVHRGNPPIGGTKYIATSWGWIQENR